MRRPAPSAPPQLPREKFSSRECIHESRRSSNRAGMSYGLCEGKRPSQARQVASCAKSGSPARRQRQKRSAKTVDATRRTLQNRRRLRRGAACRAAVRSHQEKVRMKSFHRRGIWFVTLGSLLCGAAALPLLRSRAASPQKKPAPSRHTQASQSEAFRLNTLGVAYMNQQKFAEAQKHFEKALAADPKFAIARLNLGISLLSQQKLEQARAALEEAARLLPKDPYAWYNLGLVYKDTRETEKGIDAFQHVAQLSPEADAHYFLGYLHSQLQQYDEAIAAFQKALAAFPYHASSEFGIARAYQRKGDADSARQHLARFQKITTEHLGAPFGAGYGDQGRFSLAELGRSGVLSAPAAIPLRFPEQPLPAAQSKLPGPSTGACFFDYDGDGKPDLFLVSADSDGSSRMLHNLGDGRFEDVT